MESKQNIGSQATLWGHLPSHDRYRERVAAIIGSPDRYGSGGGGGGRDRIRRDHLRQEGGSHRQGRVRRWQMAVQNVGYDLDRRRRPVQRCRRYRRFQRMDVLEPVARLSPLASLSPPMLARTKLGPGRAEQGRHERFRGHRRAADEPRMLQQKMRWLR